jgi:hypothetical protein
MYVPLRLLFIQLTVQLLRLGGGQFLYPERGQTDNFLPFLDAADIFYM